MWKQSNCHPRTASLAKLTFKKGEKYKACLQINKNRVYYYKHILKELLKDVFYFRKKESDLRRKMGYKEKMNKKSVNTYG